MRRTFYYFYCYENFVYLQTFGKCYKISQFNLKLIRLGKFVR